MVARLNTNAKSLADQAFQLAADYDLVVIGAGSAGLTAARFARQLGLSVAIVERSRVGGDCTWTGCVPSKALLKAAGVAHSARRADRYALSSSVDKVGLGSVSTT